MKLIGKIFIKGNIKALTGLRIGGNKSSLEIGGVDLNIIKTGNGDPYLPGSSIKGKMRSLLAKVRGINEVKDDPPEMKSLFGDSGGSDTNGNTRLFVRDASLDKAEFNSTFGEESRRIMDFDFSEVKTENTIDRSRGTALHPRQIERVPAGTVFNFNMLIDLYDEDNKNLEKYKKLLLESFQLMNMDYLGGHGSRGSGQVILSITSIEEKIISEDGIKDLKESKWNEIFEELMERKS